jgi:hypothetical protein
LIPNAALAEKRRRALSSPPWSVGGFSKGSILIVVQNYPTARVCLWINLYWFLKNSLAALMAEADFEIVKVVLPRVQEFLGRMGGGNGGIKGLLGGFQFGGVAAALETPIT